MSIQNVHGASCSRVSSSSRSAPPSAGPQAPSTTALLQPALANRRRHRAWTLLLCWLLCLQGAWAQLPRPLADPNIELRQIGPGRVAVETTDGGAIIAGDFRFIGGGTAERVGIVKILANGSVDTSWPVIAQDVKDMAIVGDSLYLAGLFPTVNGVSRRGLARVSVSTGALDNWNPNAGGFSSYAFYGIAVSGAEVIVGGQFTQLGGTARNNLAKIATDANGTVSAVWTASTSGVVNSVVADASSVYIGGSFATVNGSTRGNAAKLTLSGAGVLDATWTPTFNGSVMRIVLDNSNLYAVGCFGQVNSIARAFIARIGSSGAGTLDATWAPSPDSGCLNALAVTTEWVYAGGSFNQIGGAPRVTVARLAKTGSGLADAGWAPTTDASLTYFVTPLSNGPVLVGGDFARVNGSYQAGLVRLSANGANLAPVLYSEFRGSLNAALALPDNSVILGGGFARAGNVERRGVLKLTAAGSIDPTFTHSINGDVFSLALDNNQLYIGGFFRPPGGPALTSIQRVNASTGAVDASFAPVVNGSVRAIVVDAPNDRVYLGGNFSTVNGQVRSILAALSRSTGSLQAWNPGAPGQGLLAMVLDGSDLIVGGNLSTINGTAVQRLARISTGTGALDPGFTATADGQVSALLAGPAGTVYAGGFFTSINGQGRRGLARIQRSTGATDASWTPVLQTGSVSTLAAAPDGLFVGGAFGDIGGQSRRNLARLSHSGAVNPLFATIALDQAVTALATTSDRVIAGGFFGFFEPPGPATVHFRFGVAAFPLEATPVTTLLTITSDAPENSLPHQFYRVALNLSSSPLADSAAQIDVSDDRGSSCTAFLDQFGVGSCDLSSRAPGVRTLTARYAGQPLLLPSSTTTTHTVAASGAITPVNTALDLRSPVAPSATVRLSDGSVVIAGSFSRVDGVTRRGLARILADGSLDPNFAPNLVGSVTSLARDSNDQIFVSGSFGYVGNVLRRNLAKLTPAGVVVAAWQPSETCIGDGRIAVDADNNLLVPGCARLIVGSPSRYRSQLLKLSGSNGGLLNSSVAVIESPATYTASYNVQVAGSQIYLSGRFETVNAVTRANLARLDAAGVVDAAFNPAPNAAVSRLLVAADSLYLTGSFSQVAGQSRSNLAKLDLSGSLITAFAPAPNATPRDVLLDAGKLYVTGNFSLIGGLSQTCAAAVDATTGQGVPGFGFQPDVASCLGLERSGSAILISGNFFESAGAQRLGIARLDPVSGSNLPTALVSRAAIVRALARQPDGSTLLGGLFARIGGPQRNLVRISAAGSFDNSFDPVVSSTVYALNVGADGEIHLAGEFTTVDNVSRVGVAKLQPDGNLDLGFNANLSGAAYALLALPDGLVIGGIFPQASGTVRNGLAKVNPATGALEMAWAPLPSVNAFVQALQSDATGVYVGGAFSSMGGVSRSNVARVSATGSGALDSGWNANANSVVRALLVDGSSLFIGGSFTTIGGSNRRGLAKVNASAPATLQSFDAGADPLSTFALAKAQDGGLLVGGGMNRIGGVFRSNAAKLDPTTAAVDPNWNPSFDGIVYAILPGYGDTPVVARNPLVEQNVGFGGAFEFIGSVEMPGFTATPDAAPLSDGVFCNGFEDASCVLLRH